MADLKRTYVMIISAVIISIATLGYRLHRECRQRRQDKISAARDRNRIEEIAERAADEAASCAAVLDRMDTSHHQCHLRTVRGDQTGAN